MPLWFTRENVRAVDQAAIDQYAIPGVLLMENAARALFHVALDMLGGRDRAALILCGPGNNGGDGFAIARFLHNAGVGVRVVTSQPLRDYTGDAAINARIAHRMGIPIEPASDHPELPAAGLVVDALLGTGLTTAPRGVVARLIDAINAHPAPTLAVDLPSGLDCDTGQPLGACVRAERTVTFVGLKAGFASEESRAYTGVVSVGDIGAPRELVERLGERRD